MVEVNHVSAREHVDTVNTILEEDGCVVIDGLLSPDELCRLRSDVANTLQSVPTCRGAFFGTSTKRASGLISKSPVSRTMAAHPLILDVMDHHLLKSCRQYQLNLTQAIQILPGEIAQIIHSDDLMFPFTHPGKQAMINCMWAVDDFTADNGATLLVPGSHKWPSNWKPQHHEIVAGAMSAGSVLIYFGGLRHGGGANRSNAPRTGVVLSYCLGWLRQAENHYLSIPLDQVRHYPHRLQQLLGYFVHEPNLGCVNGQDPIVLVDRDHAENNRFEEFFPSEVVPIIEEYRRTQKPAGCTDGTTLDSRMLEQR